ncbi:MAG: sugar ABC transporter permease [Oscillospiraceae bacterium]|nr:sugar ABC transporter permease [Oscillospiraceae bacterium]
MLPSFGGVCLFFIVPFAVIVYYSMIESPLNHTFVWFQNFQNVLTNTSFVKASQHTLTFSATAVPLAVVLSMLLASLLESRIPGKSLFRTFFLSPLMVPVASIVLIWQVIFHYNGALNEILLKIGIEPIDWLKSSWSQAVVVLLFLWKNLGYNMILFMAAYNNMPKDLIEVAQVEGASSVYTFFMIKFRYLSPTILFVTILSLINSFKVFREIYMLAGDYPYEDLYMLQHFMNNTFANLDYQKLSAAAVFMAIVMILIILVLFVTESWFGRDIEG